MAGGRPTKYKEEYCETMVKFFNRDLKKVVNKEVPSKIGKIKIEEETANEMPFFGYFAKEISVCYDTLQEWRKVHPKFSDAYKECKKLQERFLVQNALDGHMVPSVAIFVMKNVLKWTDKVETDTSHSFKDPVQINIVTSTEKRTLDDIES